MIKCILLALLVFHASGKAVLKSKKFSAGAIERCVVPNTVALTFDDGPREDFENILNILKQNNVKATFFVLGSLLENNFGLTQRAAREGHIIASHSYSHPYLTGLSSDGNYISFKTASFLNIF